MSGSFLGAPAESSDATVPDAPAESFDEGDTREVVYRDDTPLTALGGVPGTLCQALAPPKGRTLMPGTPGEPKVPEA